MRAGLGLAVVAVAGMLGALLALLASGADLTPDGSGPGASAPVVPVTPSGAVPSGSDPPRSANATFDDLPINAAPPDPWRLEGEGTAGVIALSTSVDRSLRLVASAAGPLAACLPLRTAGGEASGFSVNLLLGGVGAADAVAASPLLELRSGEEVVFGLGVRDGRWAEPGSARDPAGSLVTPDRWMSLMLRWGAGDGEVRWAVVDGDRLVATATGQLSDPTPDTACFVAPPGGTPSVAVDDLLLER